jgi:hypothetical protein
MFGQFLCGKTPAVNVQVLEDPKPQDKGEYCQEREGDSQAPSDVEDQAQAGNEFQYRKTECYRNKQVFRYELVGGNDVGKAFNI